jgi:hypothetical protein
MGEAGDFDKWMAGDLEILSRCDAIVMCPGWNKSVGCLMEFSKAKELGIKIYHTIDEVPDEQD